MMLRITLLVPSQGLHRMSVLLTVRFWKVMSDDGGKVSGQTRGKP